MYVCVEPPNDGRLPPSDAFVVPSDVFVIPGNMFVIPGDMFVILSEAKDLAWSCGDEIPRFARNDRWLRRNDRRFGMTGSSDGGEGVAVASLNLGEFFANQEIGHSILRRHNEMQHAAKQHLTEGTIDVT